MDDQGSGVRFLSREADFSFLRSDETGSAAHPASYSMDVGGFLAG
jgi:hypothetical protein